jgi:hypothetical protein
MGKKHLKHALAGLGFAALVGSAMAADAPVPAGQKPSTGKQAVTPKGPKPSPAGAATKAPPVKPPATKSCGGERPVSKAKAPPASPAK